MLLVSHLGLSMYCDSEYFSCYQTSNKRLRFLRAAHGRVVPCRFSVRHATSLTPVDVWVTEVSMLLGVHAVGCGSHAVCISLVRALSTEVAHCLT